MISNYFSDICGGNEYIRLLSNVCVKLSRVNCTLQEAASYCSSDNATLLHIGTSDKYYTIIYLIKPLAGTFVIQDKLYSFYFHRSFLYFSFPVVRCTRYNLMKKSVSVTCGMLLVFSLYLYFSLPVHMVRCTRYNLMKYNVSVT